MTRDVVVVMVSDTWSDAVRRGFYSTADQTILSLLSSASIGKVLVVDHPRGVLSQIKRRSRGDRPAPSSGRLRGVRPFTVRTSTPQSWPAIQRRYRAYDRQIHLAARRHGLHDPALVTFNLFHAAVRSPWASRSIFYAQDDETAIPRLAAYAGPSRHAYRTVDVGETHVVSVSRMLMQAIAPESGGTVIPNGIDAALWATTAVADRDGTGRRAIYVGTVDQRVDIPAFAALCRAGFTVDVVGHVADPLVGSQLNEIDGVTIVGSQPRHEVVRSLARADLCLLAHRDTELTRAMSPLKFFEYLASGTPVVATRLPGIAEVAGGQPRAVLVEPSGDYVAGAYRALEGGRLEERDRQAVVSSLSWRARHQPLIDLLE